ncbi:MAG: DUF3795 domain-containing protein [Candidatus Saccharibacteria bacterium]
MKEYKREYPLFSLCGLNCGLCPRYQSEGTSRCPGCGGKDFHLQHPSCAVISCSKKHGDVEYCFQCESYPCKRYECPSEKDSFITYQNVINDMQKAIDSGIEKYQAELNEKVKFLEYLISYFNDGRKKNFYCIAVNLFELADLNDIKEEIEKFDESISQKDRIKMLESLFNDKAKTKNIELRLRK